MNPGLKPEPWKILINELWKVTSLESDFSCTNIYKKFREVTEWYQKSEIDNRAQAHKIKQYEQLILKGYAENFENRKKLVDTKISKIEQTYANLDEKTMNTNKKLAENIESLLILNSRLNETISQQERIDL